MPKTSEVNKVHERKLTMEKMTIETKLAMEIKLKNTLISIYYRNGKEKKTEADHKQIEVIQRPYLLN